MASYVELRGLVGYSPLRHKVQVAVMDVAVDIFAEDPPVAERVAWAKSALENPVSVAETLIHYVLIANKGSSVETIQAAGDAAIKTNVAAAVAATVAPAS